MYVPPIFDSPGQGAHVTVQVAEPGESAGNAPAGEAWFESGCAVYAGTLNVRFYRNGSALEIRTVLRFHQRQRNTGEVAQPLPLPVHFRFTPLVSIGKRMRLRTANAGPAAVSCSFPRLGRVRRVPAHHGGPKDSAHR